MKKGGLFCIFLYLCCFTSLAFSDEAPSNSHRIWYSVRIVNADDFPDFMIIGWPYLKHSISNRPYIINSQTYLDTFSTSCGFSILAITKKRFDEAGGLSGLARSANLARSSGPGTLLAEDGVFVSDTEIKPEPDHFFNHYPDAVIEEEYSITGFSDGKIHMYLSKRHTVNYNPQEKIEEFKKPSA